MNYARLLARSGVGIALTGFLALAILPIYWMVLTALRPNSAVMSWPPRLLPDPTELSLEAFYSVTSQSPVLSWLSNALFIATTSTVMTVIVSCLAGYALSRSRRRSSRFMGYAVLISKMLPGTLLVVPLYVIFYNAGLLEGRMSLIAVILANMSFAIPFATWMMKAFFDGVPVEIEEAALVDGSSVFGALVRVVLPATLPAVAAVAVYVFIVSWNDFVFARTFLPGGETTTIAAASTQFVSEVAMAWNKVMTVATLAAAPVLVVFFFLERYFVAGLVRGHH